ncbi:hypothetical protein E4U21_005759 [Claviceps maximensis]|nr:hypothetical protein E4U21_005759 [Claviceps maximensis]
MKASFAAAAAALTAGLVSANPVPQSQSEQVDGSAKVDLASASASAGASSDNDYTCRSTKHPNPVVMLHALGGNKDFDLGLLAAWLRVQEYCTFSLTYGNAPGSAIGGLESINQSAPAIGRFIKQVANRTGSARVDLVGHSEGGLQALYVPKFEAGVAQLVDKIVAVAPPTHGTSLSGLWDLVRTLGGRVSDKIEDILRRFGCRACTDLVAGSALLARLSAGPIVQGNNSVTIIASRTDVIVTPPETAFVSEPGVHNMFVQDVCPSDRVGHFGLAVAPNVWRLVRNSLERTVGKTFVCIDGIPLLAKEAGEQQPHGEAAEVMALDD